MDEFYKALVSGCTCAIPPEYDWYAPLIGDWDFDYFDGYDSPHPRQVAGEWIFRRILEGAGIGDLFLCPSRATKQANPQPDGEYGIALRMFNAAQGCYDMVYTCVGKMTRLKFCREGEQLVGTVLDRPQEKWVFSELTPTSFHWRNVTVMQDGTWRTNADVYGRRKRPLPAP